MPVTVVVGTQWGDEGKAKVIDLLSKEHGFVVRYQGGHNAGHTVVVGGERYALQLIPSGVLYDHVVPVIANGVVVDLPTLFDEIDRLEARGVTCERLQVSTRAHLIFPWHQAHDALAEALRGDDKIGTTLKGIGPAYADKARRIGLRAGDVADRASFAESRPGPRRRRERVAGATRRRAARRRRDRRPLRHLRRTSRAVPRGHGQPPARCRRRAGHHVLLEGAQATFLDLDHGTYPYVTSSNPTAGGACAGSGFGPRDIDRVVGITKAYTTRVGAGPFPTELLDADGDRLIDVGHEYGTVTGRRRRAGWLDCVMLRQAVRLNSLTEVALTKLDVLDGFDSIKVCTGYEFDGAPVRNYPDRADVLARVTPVYEELSGWGADLSGVREPADLPTAARDLLSLVEREVGVPINVIGVGAERDDYLHWATT